MYDLAFWLPFLLNLLCLNDLFVLFTLFSCIIWYFYGIFYSTHCFFIFELVCWQKKFVQLIIFDFLSSMRPLCIFHSTLIIKALGYLSETPYDQARSGVNFNVGDTCIHEIDVKSLNHEVDRYLFIF